MQIFYHHPAPSKKKRVPTVMAVKQYRPWLCPVLLFITIVTVIVCGLYLWNSSVQSFRQERQDFIEQYLQDLQDLQDTPVPNLETQELQAKLETVVSTAEELAQSLSNLQDKHFDIIEELNFYRNLTTVSKTSKKIVMSSFALHKNAEYYLYKLILTRQNARIIAAGTVQINLIGKSNGKRKFLNMATITKNSISAIDYKINYFQRITGKIRLPKKFIPEQLIIHLTAKNQAEEISFKWEKLQPKE